MSSYLNTVRYLTHCQVVDTEIWRKISMRRRLRPLLVALATLGLIGALQASIALAPPTASATPLIEIRNSANSVGPIRVFSDLHPGGVTIIAGAGNTFSDNGDVRVDPDPELGPDVDSSWTGIEGQGLNTCRPGEALIDPTSPAVLNGRYWKINTDKSGC